MYITTYVHVYMAFAGFRGLHRACNPAPGLPDPPDTVPDLCYERDFEVPDTRSVLDEFLSKMSKSGDDEYRTLSDLLATIPNPRGYARAIALSVSEAREKGLIPKADTAILEAFSA
jgi:hypothetical protein